MLKRVSIQNFKSLKDVTLDLQKVNLLIGPNNSGKTNLLKALEYIGKDIKPNVDEPNRNSYAFNRNEKINIEIRLKYDAKQNEVVSLHEFITSDTEYIVLGCTINPLYHVTRSVWEQQKQSPSIITNSIHDKNFLSEFFKRNIGYATIYKPDSNKITQPGPVGGGETTVNADASNLVGFLDLMLGKYRRLVFNRTEADLNTCIPEFDLIDLDDATPTEELRKQFGDKSFKRLGLTNSKQGLTYWADELSEGTLYFLALLCIINQPNPPKLLLLEEPEKGIHPRRIFEVIQFILRLVEEKDIQVIMTTHSPVVLDMFAEMPESVFIFDKDDEGATHVKNLQHDVIEPDTEKSKELGMEPPRYTDALGDSWTIGFLGGVPR